MRINPVEIGFWLVILGIPCSRALTEIGASILIASWIAQKLSHRDLSVKSCSLKLPLTLYVVWAGLSLIWTYDQSLSSRSFLCQTLEYVLIYLAVADQFKDKKVLHRVLWLWIIWGGFMFLDGMYQLHTGRDFLRGDTPGLIAGGARLTAAMKYPNDFGAYSALTAFVAASVGLAEWNRKRFWRSCVAWALGLLMVTALLLTYSRGAWIGFALSILVAMMLYRTRYAIPLIVAIGAVIVFLPAPYLERILHIFDMHPGSSADERLLIWKTAVNIIRQKPFLGFGLNTFNSIFPLYKDPAIWGTPYAHNCFLQLAAELGLIGLALWGWILVRFFQQGWRNDQPASWERTVALSLIAAGAGFAIHSSTDTNWYSLPLAVTWWSTLGLVDALHGVNQDRQRLFERLIRRVAYVRTDRLGDVLMNLPAIAALKTRFRKSEIHLVVRSPLEELLNNQPFVSQVVTVPPNIKSNWRGILQLTLWLRQKKYDAIVISNPSKTFHVAAFLAGIPVRVGYARKIGFLLTDSLPDEKAQGTKHETEYNLDLVRLLGAVASDHVPHLRIQEQEEADIADLLGRLGVDVKKPLIAIHPWTSDPEKQWPLTSMAQLMEQLSKDNASTLLLIGGPEEKTAAANFVAGLSFPVVTLVGLLSLRQLAALLKQCKTLVSNDSGPVHVAAAVDTPTVTLFTGRRVGSTPKRWGPAGKGHVILRSTHPEIPIPVEAVVAAVRQQFLKSSPRA